MSNQRVIDRLAQRFRPQEEPTVNGEGVGNFKPSPPLSDEDVLKMCRNAENAEKFRKLYDEGDRSAHDGADQSDSVADFALLGILAFYTQDPEQLDKLMRDSALYRDRWDKRHTGSTWLQYSIRRKLGQTTETWQPGDDGASLRHAGNADNDGNTSNPRLLQNTHSRSHSLGSTGTRERENESLKRSIQVVSFRGKDEPPPREWIVDNTIWKGHANTWYGAGGVAKSLLAMHQGITVASPSFNYWQGFAVKTVPVMYLDFELDVEEQHRRALELCRGMGLDDIPSDFYYMQASDVPPHVAFDQALEQCGELGVEFAIVDSVGFALEGDSEGSRDVLAWFRESIRPFSSAGIGTNLIDHQAKVIKGERYSDKEAFGSVYKTNSVRSAFQVHGSSEDGVITATFTHKKNNFGWKENPFSLEVSFGELVGKKSITVTRLSQAAPTPDKEPSKKEQVLWAFEEVGEGTAESIHEHTGIELKTVRNAISNLKRDGELKEAGLKDKNGSKILFPCSRTTKGTGTGTGHKGNNEEQINLDGMYPDEKGRDYFNGKEE